MAKLHRAGAMAGLAYLLTTLGPGSQAAVARIDDALLDALDPVSQARGACGGPREQRLLRQRLKIAAKHSRASSPPNQAIGLYPDLTRPTLPLSTRNAQARRYFNQGLMLSFGFNHEGAIRSFRAAQRLDPDCALCWWGEAIALGPNINAPMADADRPAALAALARAQALAPRATPLERDLIAAAARRYSPDSGADRAALDAAYADAMADVARRHPGQDEVAVLAAEAIMDTTPWNYWEADRTTPVGRSTEAVRLVETVLARRPRHAQAIHLYIHLMENSADPRRAEAAADRLATPLTPSAGHLVHMPGHIYAQTGRYRDSIRVNIAAARADEAFIRATSDQGLVRYGYYPHNVHFIVTSAQMAGDMDTAVSEAQRLHTLLDPEISSRIGWIQAIEAAPYLAMAQFAEPAAILAMAPPDARLPYARAMRHYARAGAYARQRDARGFDGELAAMEAIRAAPQVAGLVEQGIPVPALITLAQSVARGRWAFAAGDYEDAVRHYRAAVAEERTLPYTEPPFWYYPVHQSLGAALLRAGRPGEAAQAFRTALLQSPANGWALYGLAEAEEAQGNGLQAAAARRSLGRVWLGNRNWLDLDRL